MAQWRITTKRRKICNGIMVEPDMTVEVVTTGVNPLTSNRGQLVADAFMRIYGIYAVKSKIDKKSDLEGLKINRLKNSLTFPNTRNGLKAGLTTMPTAVKR